MKKDWAKLIVVFVITIGAVFWALNYLFLSGKTAPKSKASGETIEVSYDPAAPTVAAGQDTTIMVKIKPSANIALRGYTLKLKFNKEILEAKYIDYKLGVPSPEFADTSGTLTSVNEKGTINIQGEIQNSTGLIMNGGATADLVRLVFKVKAATGNTIDVSNANFFIVKSDGEIETNFISAVADLKINGGTTAASCVNFTDNFTEGNRDPNTWRTWTNGNGVVSINNNALKLTLPTSSGEAKLINVETIYKPLAGNFTSEITFLPRSDEAKTNAFFQFNSGLENNAGSTSFDGFGFRLMNGSLHTEVYGSVNPNNPGSQNHNIPVANNASIKLKLERTGTTVKMYYDLMDGSEYRLLRTFNNFNTQNGRAVVGVQHISSTNTNIFGNFDNYRQECQGGLPTDTPSPTPTGTGGGTPAATPTVAPVTGNVKITVKLKFQGISSKPDDSRNSMNVKFSLSGEGIATPLVKTGSFTSDGSGVWTGRVGFDLTSPAGKKYLVYIKGPRHIQKKICVNSPTESTAGTYRCSDEALTLAVGENTLDFSKVLQLSGDIYGPDKAQDGVVNSVDISYIKNNLRKTESAVLGICDINLDGKCDTQDYSLIISSLSIKSDEL